MSAVSALASVHFAHLTTEEARALVAASEPPVLLWPLGATEPHGPHAPLATDLIIAEGLCRRVAETLRSDAELSALVLPTLPFGVTRSARAFTGCVGWVCTSAVAPIIGRVQIPRGTTVHVLVGYLAAREMIARPAHASAWLPKCKGPWFHVPPETTLPTTHTRVTLPVRAFRWLVASLKGHKKAF